MADEQHPVPLYQEILEILRKPRLRQWERSDAHYVKKGLIDGAALTFRIQLDNALRYEFDDEACVAAITFATDHPDALISGLRWLRPLAPIVWIEFNLYVAMNTADPMIGPQHFPVDTKAGFLIIEQPEEQPCMMVCQLRLHKKKLWLPTIAAWIDPLGRLDPSRMTEESAEWELGLNERQHDIKWNRTAKELRSFIQLGACPHTQATAPQHILPASRAFAAEAARSRAFGPRAVAFLCMLNHRKLIAARLVEPMPTAGGVLGSGPYFNHTVIGINLPRIKAIGSLVRFAQRGSNLPPKRRHDVEGHWCWSRRLDLGCVHDWQPERDGDRFRCSRCRGARWYRKGHERGDASRGWVRQRRVVTTKAA